MKTANFTEFRKHAAKFLDQVERGEVVRIIRYGKHVADITSVVQESAPSWKSAPPQLKLKGVSLSQAILRNRREATR